jgi:hypothetical protein
LLADIGEGRKNARTKSALHALLARCREARTLALAQRMESALAEL